MLPADRDLLLKFLGGFVEAEADIDLLLDITACVCLHGIQGVILLQHLSQCFVPSIGDESVALSQI